MLYDVDTITADVRQAIDMNREDALIEGADNFDTLDLNSLIRSKIEDGVRAVYLMAPLMMLDTIKVEDTEDAECTVELPQDFLRFVFCKADGWAMSVYEAEDASSQAYGMQFSPYAGIRAGKTRPKAFIVTTEDGKLSLQLFPGEEGEKCAYGYIGMPEIDVKSKINLSKKVYKSVVYMTAAMVSATLNDYNLSGMLSTIGKTLLGIPVGQQEQEQQ